MAKKKENGFDKLARLIKSESEAIRGEMATKDDIARLEAKISGVGSKLTSFEKDEVDKRLQLHVRVTNLEKKVGV